MKFFATLLVLCLVWLSSSLADETTKKPPPLVACIEPSLMRTEASQLLPGSKKTVIVPAWSEDLGLSRLSKEEFAATGLKWEQFLTQAAAVAAAHLKTLKPEIHRDAKNVAQYAVLSSESHLTAGIILCPEFFAQFREVFGDRLVAIVPDRFTVYVFPRGFPDFQTMGPGILEKYGRSVWPCSQEAFEITADGLKCLGAFVADDGTQTPAKGAPAKPSAKPVPAKPTAKPAPAKPGPAKNTKKVRP
jgi:hypothetical protein